MCAKAVMALLCILFTECLIYLLTGFCIFSEFLVTIAWDVSLHGLLMGWNHLGCCKYYFLTIVIFQNFYLHIADSKSVRNYWIVKSIKYLRSDNYIVLKLFSVFILGKYTTKYCTTYNTTLDNMYTQTPTLYFSAF